MTSLLLKWGSLKGWSDIKEETPAYAALERYFIDPVSMSAAVQQDTGTQKQALLDLIDAVYAEGGSAQNDWDGTTYATAAEAKAYITGYGRE